MQIVHFSFLVQNRKKRIMPENPVNDGYFCWYYTKNDLKIKITIKIILKYDKNDLKIVYFKAVEKGILNYKLITTIFE